MTGFCFAVLAALCLINHGDAQAIRSHGPENSSIAQARAALASKPAEAIRILLAYIQSHPKDTSARLLLADAYLVVHQAENAQEQYQAILQFAPNNYRAMAGMGELYERSGELDKAESLLAQAVQISHRDPKLQTAWATLLARLHRYADASRALRGVPVPRSARERVPFFRLKASVAAGLGDMAAAASEMEQALSLSRDDAALELATGTIELQAGHFTRACILLNALFARSHDPSLGIMLLQAQLRSGKDVQPTLDALRTVTLAAEQELVLRQKCAELLIGSGRFAQSIDEFKRAVQLDPSRSDLVFNLALAQFKAGRYDDALATTESLQKNANSAELEELAGDIQEARGDNLEAVQHYQTAVALAPNEEEYRLSLALELMRHKSFEPARLVLQQAQEIQPDSWRILVALGIVDYFAGSAENAVSALLKAAERSPQPESALRYLGDIEMDQVGAPNAAALDSLCQYADHNPQSGSFQLYCAALLFRRDYASRDRTHIDDILQRLNASARALPDQAGPHCQLGKAYRWIESWQSALRESEICARLDADSADAHYRLAQIYQHLGRQKRSEQEMKLYQAASSRMADANAKRDQTIKTFLYSIRNPESPK